MPGVTVIFPAATIVALPIPRLSAWMPADSVPLEVMPGPIQLTLATCEVPVRFGIANTRIASLLAVPFTLIVVFVAAIVASPLDCMRRPVLLLPSGFAVLSMFTPLAVIVMLALLAV